MSLYESLEGLCGSILDLYKDVDSIAVLDKRGGVIECISKPVFSKQFPDHLNELFCMHHVLQISMGREFDEKYGPINYHISERRNNTILTFPLGEKVILVTAGKTCSLIEMAQKISSLINEHKKRT